MPNPSCWPAQAALSMVVLHAAAWAGSAEAQQRFEIDHFSGRQIVNEWTYALRELAAIDPVRQLVYAVDAENPVAVKVFSIVDGSVVATLAGSEGDGPGELRELVALDATSRGVLAASHTRVQHWSLDGSLLDEWRPTVPGVFSVCAMGTRVTVPLQGDGVLLRAEDGSESVLGEGRPAGVLNVGVLTSESVRLAGRRFSFKRAACLDEEVFVLAGRDHQMFGYSPRGARREVMLPPELADEGRRQVEAGPGVLPYSNLTHDDRGRLVVTMWDSRLAAAIIDPDTGCHSLVTDPSPSAGRHYVGVYRDSIMAMESPPVTRIVDGRPQQVVSVGDASIIALHPLVATGGEPC